MLTPTPATTSITLSAGQAAVVRLLLAGMYWPLRGFMSPAQAAAVAHTGRLDDSTPWGLAPVLEVPARTGGVLPPVGAICLLQDAEGVPVARLEVAEAHSDGVGFQLAGAVTTEAGAPCEAPSPRRNLVAVAVDECLHAHTAALLLRRLAEQAAADLLVLRCVREADAISLRDFVHAEATRGQTQALAAQTGRQVTTIDVQLLSQGDAAVRRECAVLAANAGARALFVPDDEVGAETAIPLLPIGAACAALAAHGHLAVAQSLARGDAVAGLSAATARLFARAYPPRHRQGFCILLTGLSGAGKSTIARSLAPALMHALVRPVTLLDGDVVRTHLSSGLGFDRAGREANLARLGFVAREICQAGGVVICAPIAPYAQSRAELRARIEAVGGFVEVHVATPLEVCEQRDPKGLYARARAGQLATFTGIDDPYEVPAAPDLRIDTSTVDCDGAVRLILETVAALGYISTD